MQQKKCVHLTQIEEIKTTRAYVCAECVKTGDAWVHLRTCQTCGVTLCCDSSPNKHATKHYKQSGHPVVKSAEPNENWLWCYQDAEMSQH